MGFFINLTQAKAKMSKTGEMPVIIYYALGTAFIGLGIHKRRKSKRQ